jgi:beta-lactamase regulating signal transducer with metallopeptidase domain
MNAMNLDRWGLALADLLLQVTLWTGLGLALYAAVARGRPRAGARLATAVLAGVVALTGLALAPVPLWRLGALLPELPAPAASRLDHDPATAPDRATVIEVASAAGPGGAGAVASWLKELFGIAPAILPAGQPRPSSSRLSPPGLLTGALALCACVFGVRLALGLWAVRRLRRQSRPLVDARLRGLLDELHAALELWRPVELRELPDLGTPATVGWRRPLVLLPRDWRAWSDAERRSVLAHELAHVRHGDYAAWLLAQVGAALHGYHPLVRWLLGRLQGDQELTADAVAAHHAGGPTPYVQALCRLALRHGGRGMEGPARAFLPVRLSLVRRIAMLRKRNWEGERPLPWSRRLILGAVLLAAGVAIAGLRRPALAEDKPKGEPAAPARTEPAGEDGLTSLGVWTLRPGSLCARRELRGAAKKIDAAVALLFLEPLFGPGHCDLKLDQVEQVVGGLSYSLQPPQGDRKGMNVLANVGLIRLKPGRSWDFLAAIPGIEKTSSPKGISYRLAKPPPLLAGLLGATTPLSCFVPDERTLVFGNEERARAWIEHANALDAEKATGEPAWLTVAVKPAGIKAFLAAAKDRLPTEEVKRFAPLWETGGRLLVTCRGTDRVLLGLRVTATPGADAAAFDAAFGKATAWLMSNVSLAVDTGAVCPAEPAHDRSPRPTGADAGHQACWEVVLEQRLPDLLAYLQGDTSKAEQITADLYIVRVPPSFCKRHGLGERKQNGGVVVMDEAAKAQLLKAVQEVLGCDILSRPTIMMLPNQVATIAIGQNPDVVEGKALPYGPSPSNIQVQVRPSFKDDKETFLLDLEFEFGFWTQSQPGDPPRLNATKVTTKAEVPPGQTGVLVCWPAHVEKQPDRDPILLVVTPRRHDVIPVVTPRRHEP